MCVNKGNVGQEESRVLLSDGHGLFICDSPGFHE